MPIPGLTIIGESINDSVPSTKALFDTNDVKDCWSWPRLRTKKAQVTST